MASRTSSIPLPETPKESVVARVSNTAPLSSLSGNHSLSNCMFEMICSDFDTPQLLIAPITFISFIVSLAIIDNRNASLRHHIHSPSYPPTPGGLFGQVKNTFHSWVYRRQPYAYIKSLAALEREKSGDNVKGKAAKEEPWHWNTKQKKMMKMEVADAFEMRKWVVGVMAVAAAAFAAGGVWLVSWSYGMIMRYM